MATTPSTKRPAPAKKKVPVKPKPKPATRVKAPAPSLPKKDKPPRLGGHGYDVGGLVLMLLALVTALSV